MDKLAQRLHDYRVFPRLTLVFYLCLMWDLWKWSSSLENPTAQQVAIITIFVGLAGVIFGFYTKTTSGTDK